MELCSYCEEYSVDSQPVGTGERIPTDDGKGSIHMCEHCGEYSIKTVLHSSEENAMKDQTGGDGEGRGGRC